MKFKKGHKHSEETKKKMSISQMGHKNYNGFLGKKHTEEWKNKMSLKLKGRKHTEEWNKNSSKGHKGQVCLWLRGKNHHNWRGGVSKDKEYLIWQKKKRRTTLHRLKIIGSFHTLGEWKLLKAQYNWTCPCCKKQEPEIKLTEDHIIPLSKGGSDNIENIQPLCLKCNKKKFTKIIKY